MSPSKMSIRILVSILFVCVVAHGQLLNRRLPFNLVRQQKQLDTDDRQSSVQQPTQDEAVVDNPPVNRATFERLFEAVRMINELFQTLSAIRARFSSDSTQTQNQVTSNNVPVFFNNQ